MTGIRFSIVAAAFGAILLLVPRGVEAQECWFCDPDLYGSGCGGCSGTFNGSASCAQPAPCGCDMYGDECHSFAATPSTIGASGMLAFEDNFSAAAEDTQMLAVGEPTFVLVATAHDRVERNCKGEIIKRRVTVAFDAKMERQTRTLSL